MSDPTLSSRRLGNALGYDAECPEIEDCQAALAEAGTERDALTALLTQLEATESPEALAEALRLGVNDFPPARPPRAEKKVKGPSGPTGPRLPYWTYASSSVVIFE